jgi:predicted metal-binding membrane protein
VQPRRDYAALMALLIAGYLAVWAGFGIAAHLLDAAVNAGVRQSDWLMLNGWAIGAAVLALAGLFQFSRLKYRCLDKCRAPFGFITERWQGPRPWRSAWRLGLDHGVYCVGCCWALMLLMFVVGTGNVGWMLGLGAIMAVEKNMPWGRHLSRPLGATLVLAAILVVSSNLRPG